MARALVIQHVAYEDLAGFRAPIEEAGYDIAYVGTWTDAFAEADFLTPDLLVVLGGPMGVYEGDDHPWIAVELEKLSARLAAGGPTLGICLGCQMIAAALGATVAKGPVREAGFAPVTLTAAGEASPLRALVNVPVLHWHGDSFTLPDGVEVLAGTGLYAHQAFRRGPNLLALQFHPEMGPDWLQPWLERGDKFLAGAGTSVTEVREAALRLGPGAIAAGRDMLRTWLAALRN